MSFMQSRHCAHIFKNYITYSFICVYLYMCMHMPKHACVPEDTMWVQGIKLRSLVLAATSLPTEPSLLPSMHCFQFLIYWGKQGLKEFCAFPNLTQRSTWQRGSALTPWFRSLCPLIPRPSHRHLSAISSMDVLLGYLKSIPSI